MKKPTGKTDGRGPKTGLSSGNRASALRDDCDQRRVGAMGRGQCLGRLQSRVGANKNRPPRAPATARSDSHVVVSKETPVRYSMELEEGATQRHAATRIQEWWRSCTGVCQDAGPKDGATSTCPYQSFADAKSLHCMPPTTDTESGLGVAKGEVPKMNSAKHSRPGVHMILVDEDDTRPPKREGNNKTISESALGSRATRDAPNNMALPCSRSRVCAYPSLMSRVSGVDEGRVVDTRGCPTYSEACQPQPCSALQDAESIGMPHNCSADDRTKTAACMFDTIINLLDKSDASSHVEMPAAMQEFDRKGKLSCREPHDLVQDALAVQIRVSALEKELEERQVTIESLMAALSETEEHATKAIQKIVEDRDSSLCKQRVDHQKEMASCLQRHSKLVDELLRDKAELAKRMEELSQQSKAKEAQLTAQIAQLQETAAKQLANQKKNLLAVEKLRREDWEKEKVKEIKAMTIRGLEPDIERLLQEHKRAKQDLEDQHSEAMATQRRELLVLAESQVSETRAQLLREHEHTLEQEREILRQKSREDFDRFNKQLQDERSRFATELLDERKRCEQQLQLLTDMFQAQLADVVVERDRASDVQQIRHFADIFQAQLAEVVAAERVGAGVIDDRSKEPKRS